MASDEKKSGCPITEIDLDFLKLQYQVLSERRINHNTLLWNVPSMLFVAQTFMWTIAVNNGNNALIRCAVSFLSIIISYISFQLFERNRLMEVVDAEQMYSIESYFQTLDGEEKLIPTMIIHHKLSMRTLICGDYKYVSEFINNHMDYMGKERKKEKEEEEKKRKEEEEKGEEKEKGEDKEEEKGEEKEKEKGEDKEEEKGEDKEEKEGEDKEKEKDKKKPSKLWQKESSKLWKKVFISFFILSCAIFLYNIVDLLKYIDIYKAYFLLLR